MFDPRPGRESNWGPRDLEADILTNVPTPPLFMFHMFSAAVNVALSFSTDAKPYTKVTIVLTKVVLDFLLLRHHSQFVRETIFPGATL